MLHIVLALLVVSVHCGGLQETESYRSCTGDPESPSFLSTNCPDSGAYTRAVLNVDIGRETYSEIRFVSYPPGNDGNATRDGRNSSQCPVGPCTEVPLTTLRYNFAGARAEWSLVPAGFSLPWSYGLHAANNTGVGRCSLTGVTERYCSANSTCDLPATPINCTASPTCVDYGDILPSLDDVGATCGFAAPVCYELCCGNFTAYQVRRTEPQCRVFQAVGPPLFRAKVDVRVANENFDKTLRIAGGIGDRILGTVESGSDLELRGYMRKTVANPSVFDVPTSVSRGLFVFCDDTDGVAWNSGRTARNPPTCMMGDVAPFGRWYYIPPQKAAVYGVGSRQYGQDELGVLQDLAAEGCNATSNFTELVPGHTPNTNPGDPTSDFVRPSPCTVLGMIVGGDPRAQYWLPPGYGASGVNWRVDGSVLSVAVDTDGIVFPNAFQIDVDIPTETMGYRDTVTPGFVDEDVSACFTTGRVPNNTDVAEGFLAPVVCNPDADDPQNTQLYALRYQCASAVTLERQTDTITLAGGVCSELEVPLTIPVASINSASKVCNVFLDPAGDAARPVPFHVQCAFGHVLGGSSSGCSVWEFGCNFRGESGGAWYRCVPFWIIFAVVLGAIAVLIWFAVTRSQRKQVDSRNQEEMQKLYEDRLISGF